MASFVAVTMLSLFTLCYGTYTAELVENRRCAKRGQTPDQPERRRAEQ